MNENTKIYLRDIAFRANALADKGATTSLEKVYEEIDTGRIIEWLSKSGADMSILLSRGCSHLLKCVYILPFERGSGCFGGC